MVEISVIANTRLFTQTSFIKQSASWKVLEICALCALSADSQKTYSVNTLVAAATASIGGGEVTQKEPWFRLALESFHFRMPILLIFLPYRSLCCPISGHEKKRKSMGQLDFSGTDFQNFVGAMRHFVRFGFLNVRICETPPYQFFFRCQVLFGSTSKFQILMPICLHASRICKLGLFWRCIFLDQCFTWDSSEVYCFAQFRGNYLSQLLVLQFSYTHCTVTSEHAKNSKHRNNFNCPWSEKYFSAPWIVW